MADPDPVYDNSPGALAGLLRMIRNHLLLDVNDQVAIERIYAEEGNAKVVFQPGIARILDRLRTRLASSQMPPQLSGATLTMETTVVTETGGKFAASTKDTPVLTVPLQPRTAISIETRACTMTVYVILLVLTLVGVAVLIGWGIQGAPPTSHPIPDTPEF
jgi:hypothetical protein